MKKIFILLVVSVMLNACYDDYVKDYEYDGIYFPYQLDVRTFVVGEGMKIQFGVALGGVSDNVRDRIVNYQLDNTLISAQTLASMKNAAPYIKTSVAAVTDLKLLPANYYSLSDNGKFVIKAGQYSGTVTLKADSAKFLADAATLAANYALPVRITTADADTVLLSKNYAVIGLKYENMLFGNYWHGGVTLEKDAAGTVLKTTAYYTAINAPTSKAWALTTVEPMSLTTNGYADITNPTKQEMKLTQSGGKITIGSLPGASVQILPDGECTFNQAKLLQNRKIFLKYKYVNAAGNTCYANDTLTFRNRIRDGINEWQDENPNNYK
jgi:hypothetical protein